MKRLKYFLAFFSFILFFISFFSFRIVSHANTRTDFEHPFNVSSSCRWGAIQNVVFYEDHYCGDTTWRAQTSGNFRVPQIVDGCNISFDWYFSGCNGNDNDGLGSKLFAYITEIDKQTGRVLRRTNTNFLAENSRGSNGWAFGKNERGTVTMTNCHSSCYYTVSVEYRQKRGHDQQQRVGAYIANLVYNTPSGNIPVKFKPTLTIDPNGGTYAGTTGISSYNQDEGTTKNIEIPTRTGYIFSGWTLSGSGYLNNNIFTFGSDDTVLTAKWKPINYEVKYEKGLTDDTTITPENTKHKYDEAVTLTKNIFTGKKYELSFDTNLPLAYTGKVTDSIIENVPETITGNLPFNKWQVKASNNSGLYPDNINIGIKNFEYIDGKISTATATYNEQTINFANPSLPGYQFDGWFNNKIGGTLYNKNASTSSTIIKPSPTIQKDTLFAHWTPNTYYVVYVDYDGNGTTNNTDKLNSHNKLQTCTYDQLYYYEPDRPSSDEKVFLGWSTVNPDTYTWTEKNIEDEPIWVQANSQYTNLSQKQYDTIYLWAVWAKVKDDIISPDGTNSYLINTDQIQIEGSNVYKDPTRDKTYYIQDNTLFDLSFNGISQIDKEYLRKYFMSTQNAFNDSHKNLSQLTKIDLPIEQKIDVTADATLTNTGSLINVEDFTARRTADCIKLNYKQNYMLNADKDNMLINIYPTSQVTFINPFRDTESFTAFSDINADKKHEIMIICDSTPTTIMIPEEYDVDENGYVPIIEEDVTIPIKYADFVKNVNPSNPEYGSGVNTKNITVTLTQEQTDDGGAPYSQVFKDDTLSEIIKIKESSAYTGEIDLTFSPSKFSEISGFITIKIDITDNVGITVSKEYRFLVMRLETSLKNTVKASKYFDTSAFAQGENGQILIETNGFIDKASIAFTAELDNLAAEEKSNAGDAESGYWHVGRTLSDTYPRDKDGNIVTVLPQMQTKLWGTTHKGGMQWNGTNFEHSYLTHYFYAPLYTQKGKYPVVVTIYKTDPKDNSKIYNVTKTLNLYIGMAAPAGEGEEQLSDPVPITEEIRDELKDN